LGIGVVPASTWLAEWLLALYAAYAVYMSGLLLLALLYSRRLQLLLTYTVPLLLLLLLCQQHLCSAAACGGVPCGTAHLPAQHCPMRWSCTSASVAANVLPAAAVGTLPSTWQALHFNQLSS
jgi:hypothetical protein